MCFFTQNFLMESAEKSSEHHDMILSSYKIFAILAIRFIHANASDSNNVCTMYTVHMYEKIFFAPDDVRCSRKAQPIRFFQAHVILSTCSFEKEFLFYTIFIGTRRENWLFELENLQF